MSKLRVVSGDYLIKNFVKLGFEVVEQSGSHVKIQRYIRGEKQTLTIPLHQELDRGMTKGIYNQALKYLHEEKIRNIFYT